MTKVESRNKRKSRIVGNNMRHFAFMKKVQDKKTSKKKRITYLSELLKYGNQLDYLKGCFGKSKELLRREEKRGKSKA